MATAAGQELLSEIAVDKFGDRKHPLEHLRRIHSTDGAWNFYFGIPLYEQQGDISRLELLQSLGILMSSQRYHDQGQEQRRGELIEHIGREVQGLILNESKLR